MNLEYKLKTKRKEVFKTANSKSSIFEDILNGNRVKEKSLTI